MFPVIFGTPAPAHHMDERLDLLPDRLHNHLTRADYVVTEEP
jgi:hypothetical protein